MAKKLGKSEMSFFLLNSHLNLKSNRKYSHKDLLATVIGLGTKSEFDTMKTG